MKLGKAITYIKGKAPQESSTEEQVLYLSPEYLRGNSIGTFIPNYSTKVEVESKDLVLLWDGSNAGEFFKAAKGVLSSTMVKLVFDVQKFDRDFLFYQLKSFEPYLKSQTNGSGIPHVDRELFLNLELTSFVKSEQFRIAEILSTADKAIAATEDLIAKYRLIKTGLMEDLLTRGIDEEGNIRSKSRHRFVLKNGIEVPEEWEVEKMINHCESSAFGPRFPGSLYSVEGNVGTLRTTDVDGEGNIDYKSIPLARLDTKLFSKHFLHSNDLLITRSGTVGIVSVYEEQTIEIIPGAFLIRFRLMPSVNPKFLRYYFINETGKKRLLELAEGGVQKTSAAHRF